VAVVEVTMLAVVVMEVLAVAQLVELMDYQILVELQ
jgi:hypothetical protein